MTKKAGIRAVLAAVMAVSMLTTIPANSAKADKQDMTVRITKDATYTLTIPSATDRVNFGAENTVIGNLSVKGDIGTKQKVRVGATKTEFVDVKDSTNRISFNLKNGGNNFSAADWNRDAALNKVGRELTINIPAETWKGKASGNYTATITFTAELQDIK